MRPNLDCPTLTVAPKVACESPRPLVAEAAEIVKPLMRSASTTTVETLRLLVMMTSSGSATAECTYDSLQQRHSLAADSREETP